MEPSNHQQYEQHSRHLIHEEPLYAVRGGGGRGNNHMVATPSSSKNDENVLTNGSRTSSNGEVRFNSMYGDPRESMNRPPPPMYRRVPPPAHMMTLDRRIPGVDPRGSGGRLQHQLLPNG